MGDGGEDSKVRISVWWDIENCMVPNSVRPHDVARNISKALRQENFRGPISISAYGDTHRLSHEVQTAITSTGINLHHIPSGHKDASDKAIIVDMLFWALDNPPPAHILLISGDRDFSNTVHRLHMKNYNILLAGYLEESFSGSLLGAATSVWHWTKLARGENAEASHPQKSDGISPGIVKQCNINVPVVPSDVSCNTEDDKNSVATKISDQSAASLPSHTSVKVQTTADAGLKPDLIDKITSFPNGQVNFHAGTSTGNDHITTSDKNGRPSNEVAPTYLPARPMYNDGRPGGGTLFTHGVQEVSLVQGHLPSNMPLPVYSCCIEIILKVMETLKREMLPPTEVNIEVWIHRLELPLFKFTLRQVLDKAIEMGDIVVLSEGIGHVQVFIPKNTKLWPFVDPNSPNQYASEIWNTLHAWLYSQEGQQIVSQSQSLENVAVLLRKCGPRSLSCLPLAKIANLLQLAANVKGWLRPSPCSWPPLFITEKNSFNRLNLPNGTFQPRQSGMECAQSIGIQSHEQKASKPRTVDTNLVMKKLRCWLIYVLCTERARKGYDISSLRKDFEAECKVKLDPLELGYGKLVDLIKQLKDVARLEHPRSNQCLLFPANEKAVRIVSKLRSWLSETLSTEKASNGYDISLVKRNFELDCNVKLDQHKLGFDKLQDLISLFTDIVRLEHPRKDTCLLFRKDSSVVNKLSGVTVGFQY
ncbi:hypothetical protein O6H91_16G074900 [Diphasiastrum complanatum]|nr:hypothetical protein O6H91_16G074900 [Diphasiastrum complanatum]KAJ7527884.1 hypothetical protein O6H91_16G074900 [Diphasiastrum complanatum]KAJ7527885.1 hypothetical protein O6H91_16G074900 [Diphasiastrum complanatum]KAJ7527886.1 hypothetical protein O6H91_16G074900 [Diphasiastrum complanatum]KAJ7527887.1 hypothetical protein O6H91_16G074900 [Diphasiastrum complanatum]